ncbi:hypothetical protein ACVR0S_05090 [Streptococcus dentapri]|uniref:Uncharacterized protein n=1 Tax=Streptococcus dentapri TaxID=573564 RepID=A0ABV8D0Y2_9STRE
MFLTEFELVDSFIKFSKKNKKFYIRELPTNFGRPDIIELSINTSLLEKRLLNSNVPYIQRVDTYILSYLKGKSYVKKETVLRNLNLDLPILNSSLSRLLNRDMIDIDGNLIRLKSINDLLFISSLSVYEAKLTNWKYVIEQAERHLWFSNQSFILLPELSEDIQQKAKELAHRRGVGVAVMNNHKIIFKTKNRKNKLINTPLLWEINEEIIDGKFKIE